MNQEAEILTDLENAMIKTIAKEYGKKEKRRGSHSPWMCISTDQTPGLARRRSSDW